MPSKKRKHDNPSLKTLLERPWCYYCNKDFDDLRILIDHQKAKHYKCLVHGCNRHLNTAGGLRVHMSQVHKEDVRFVPNALEDRHDIHVEIFGMEGVPPHMIEAHNATVTAKYFEKDENRRQYEQEQQAALASERSAAPKKIKTESSADIKRRVAEAIARKKAGLAPNPEKSPAGTPTQDDKQNERKLSLDAQSPHSSINSPLPISTTQSASAIPSYPYAPSPVQFPPNHNAMPNAMAPGYQNYGHYPPGMPAAMPEYPNHSNGYPPPHMPYGMPPNAGYPPTGPPPPHGYNPYSMGPAPSVSPLTQAPVAHGLPPRPTHPVHVSHHSPQHTVPREPMNEQHRRASAYAPGRPQPGYSAYDRMPRGSTPPLPFKYFRDSAPDLVTDDASEPPSNTSNDTSPHTASVAQDLGPSQPMTVQELIDREEKRANQLLNEEKGGQNGTPDTTATPVTGTVDFSSVKSSTVQEKTQHPPTTELSLSTTQAAAVTDTATPQPSAKPTLSENTAHTTSQHKGKSRKTGGKLKLADNLLSWEEKRAATFGTFVSGSMQSNTTTTGPTSDAVSGAVDEELS